MQLSGKKNISTRTLKSPKQRIGLNVQCSSKETSVTGAEQAMGRVGTTSLER